MIHPVGNSVEKSATDTSSGIKVLDRSIALIDAVATGDKTLSELSAETGLPRATTHRLATALEIHQILVRTEAGAWTIGPALARYAASAPSQIIDAAKPIMAELVDLTNESVQLYELTGTTRTCVAAIEPPSGLTHTVPVGSQLPLDRGSAAKIFAAHKLVDAAFPDKEMVTVRSTGLAESVAEREVGLASVSAPIYGPNGAVLAVLSISGPVERLKPSPTDKWGKELQAAAQQLNQTI
ncbi:IclR family transcriptional regulator [uncultured Corynebacterium sp.]|uniref:IclR family transcriptional regulator n=1 Tax=uncultured Corynebacterium sp. TaxID=159447 RepID=UPI00261EC7D1|nr:IclR family transcriptional regulator [uncultured Corynebacterium sp.]